MSGRIADVFYIDRLYFPYLELPVDIFWLEEDRFFLKQEGKDTIAVMILPNEQASIKLIHVSSDGMGFVSDEASLADM
jgi:hypothetical protein